MTNPEEIADLYDLIKKIATEKPFTRESYKALIFEVWIQQGDMKFAKKGGYYVPMQGDHYKNLSNPNTIGRTYRKVKKDYPELGPRKQVEEWRKEREAQMRDINIMWQPQRVTTNSQSLLLPYEGGGGCISCGTQTKEG